MSHQKTWFISDLHLDENHPHTAAQFLHLLNSADQTVDALYILGDLFEAWIGDDDETPFYEQIINALQKATHSGLKIYFLCGNRDFLIGKRFLRKTGCQLIPHETKIWLYGTPTLLVHGDILCTRDVAYLKARKKAHNVFLQKLFLILPLSIRKKIADKMRAKSNLHTHNTPLAIMDVTEDEVIRLMLKHQVDLLIHGHTHRPAFHTLSLAGKNALRIVLGAWHEKGNVLICDEKGNKNWVLL